MGRLMIDAPSPAFAPPAKLTAWLERCAELRKEFGHDAGALADIAESEHEVRAALERQRPARTEQTRRSG
jgi:hypothetical protein